MTRTRRFLPICLGFFIAAGLPWIATAGESSSDAGKFLTLDDIAVVEKKSSVIGGSLPALRLPTGGPTIRGWGALERFLSSNRDIASCSELASAYRASGQPQFNGLETIREIDGTLKAQMSYRHEYNDKWNNLSAQILAGESVDGDCDDMAITAAALAICSGASPSRIGFAIFNAETYGKQSANHMVATYIDSDRRVYVFGDTNGPVWNSSVHELDPLVTASMASISKWYRH